MKKTLLLMALLGTLAATDVARAEVYWTDGLDETTAQNYTFTKFRYTDHYDGYNDDSMCFAISACNTLAWWQDQVEKNGALIIPKDAPRGEDIWAEIRKEWYNDPNGGQPNLVMQYYLTGYTNLSDSSLQTKLTQAGRDFLANKGGYYKHLSGAYYNWSNTARYPEYTMIKYVDARGYNSSTGEYENGFTSYEGASKYLVELLQEGYGGVLKTDEHVMSFYAVETNEDGLITKIWYDDNNYDDHTLTIADVYAGTPNKSTGNATIGANVKYGNNLRSFSLIRTKGIQFDTYGMTMTGAEGEEELFSHYLNLTIDGHTNYELKYDLRDAQADGSPVNALNDEGQGITTGDISIKNGKLSLVACDEDRIALDGGGKTTGTISFESKNDATRTLSVQHSDTIAKEIKINAADGNTLEVTEGNTATFGKLTGKGNLVKAGAGTAEVTEEVSLKGKIDVQDGLFVLGVDATLSSETVLTVAAEGKMKSQADTPVTLTIESGTHTNDGEMKLTTTLTGGTLKGSGTFGAVSVDGGTLIVGNSPGQQTYEGNLSVNSGDIVFSVSDWSTAATEDIHGWNEDAYSNLVMSNNALTFGDEAALEFAVGGSALDELRSGKGGFSMDIATGISNTEFFNSELLDQLALATTFYVANEDEAGLNASTPLTVHNLEYTLEGTTLRLSGSFEQQVIPEPATGTLSLLALVGLVARRRKK